MAIGDEVPQVSAEDAIALVAEGVTLVDVREQDEWDSGHAPGATFLPLSELQSRVSELPTDSRLLVICLAGSRSMQATAFLLDHGLDASNVDGGMIAWSRAGGALTANTPEA